MNSKTRTSSEAFHIRHRNFFVGVFLLVPLIIIPSAVVYTFGKSELFTQWCMLHVRYDEGTGLQAGDEVTFRGIRVGNVRAVSLDPDGMVHVVFRIEQSYAPLVRKDSRALVRQKNLVVGDWQIELTGGSAIAPEVVSGDTLLPEFPLKVDAIVNQMIASLGMVQEVLTNINEGKGALGKLVTQDSLLIMAQSIGEDIRRLVRTTNRTVRNLDTTIVTYRSLGKNSSHLIDSLVIAADQFGTFLDEFMPLAKKIDTLPEEVQKTLTALQKDIRETEVILKAVQKHWFLRRQVRKVREEE